MNKDIEEQALHISTNIVRYYDTDLSQAVFFTNHIKWFDSIAIIDFLRAKGIVWNELLEDNTDAVVASVTFDYLEPSYIDDIIDITIENIKIGNKSIRFFGSIYKHDDGNLIARGSLVYVIVDFNTRKAIPIPDNVRTRLESQ